MKSGDRANLRAGRFPQLIAPAERESASQLYSGSGRSRLPPLLETFATEDGTPLGRSDRNRSFLPTLRADGTSFNLGETVSRCTWRCFHHGDAFCLAGFAPLGLVLELLVVKEQLFPGREDEVGPAVDALQYFVLEFHGDAPFNHPDSMHSANERQPTLVTRARAQSSPTSSVALLKIDPGFGRPYWQKYGFLSHHQTLGTPIQMEGDFKKEWATLGVGGPKIISPALCELSSGYASAPALLLHASFRRASGKRSAA